MSETREQRLRRRVAKRHAKQERGVARSAFRILIIIAGAALLLIGSLVGVMKYRAGAAEDRVTSLCQGTTAGDSLQSFLDRARVADVTVSLPPRQVDTEGVAEAHDGVLLKEWTCVVTYKNAKISEVGMLVQD